MGEEIYLEQIVRNLLTNAAKYSPPGSRIAVTAAPGRGWRGGQGRRRGIGLPPGDPERLFDLYYRSPEATRTASGAGIGLFVARQLLAAMSGRIWATRREKGSEFGFDLLPLRGGQARSERSFGQTSD